MKGRILTIIIVCVLLLAGVCVLGYPWFSNWYASRGYARVIQNYDATVDGMSMSEINDEFDKATRYNLRIGGAAPVDPFSGASPFPFDDYTEILNVNGNGVMAYLMIPKIDAMLPVYHGVTAEVLERGIGHIPTTALPVGGEGTHCVLAGHRGLPAQELFTRLDVLSIGDEFYINVMGRMMAYQVDDISVVLPEETDILKPAAGEDYVTLSTCTPLGVNSHRLLVRGTRIPYVPGQEQQADRAGLSKSEIELIIGASIAIIFMVIAIILAAKRRKRKEEEESDDDFCDAA
ncbi:MAG: class C sortase [Clostridiales Family XIII bacterium]|jgi:sortase A|nr:class C sortase [Clostridiales Family XIII bacterium]